MINHTQIRKRASNTNVKDAVKPSSGKQSGLLPNSAMLDYMGIPDESSENLDEKMRDRVQQVFLANQIPSAEREADNIAAGQSNARTLEEVKSQMGGKMGADFSSVRFHTDSAAVQKVEAIGARAYTSGRDIYFGEGGFSPEVAAHELVHTVQQGVVASAMPTDAAPSGGIQMMPKWLKRVGNAVSSGASAVWRSVSNGLSKAGTFIKEFGGGKMGLLGPGKQEKRENVERAKKGDFSRIARISKADRQELDEERKNRIRNRLAENPDMTSEEISQRYGGDATKALDPVNRKALSDLSREGGPESAKIKEAMEMTDQRMMMDTILGPSEEDKGRLKRHYQHRDDQKRLMEEYEMSKSGKMWLGTEAKDGESGKEAYQRIERESNSGDRTVEAAQTLADQDINKAKESGDSLMRTMFLMQLGDFQRTDEKKNPEKKWWQFWKKKKLKEQHEWDDTMANAFSHGGRTGFVFGANEKNAEHSTSDDVSNALFGTKAGQEIGHDAGVHTRAAGTHHLATPGKNGGLKGYKEHSGVGAAIKAVMDKNYNHYGMDMAIGGVGKLGGRGEGGKAQMINIDGRSGHMYIGKKSSTDKEKGGLLMGLESDSPYRMNQTGHMHNAAAQAEEGSSTGGSKQDLRGKKYGGRTVDLSGIGNSELTGTLQSFSGHMDALRRDDPEQYKALVKKMTGKRMTDEEMTNLLVQFMPQGEGDTPDAHRANMTDIIRRGRKRG